MEKRDTDRDGSEPEMMRVADAARRAGIRQEELADWIKKGRVKGYMSPDGRERVRLSEIKEYMTAHGLEGSRDSSGSDEGRDAVLVVDDDAMVRGMIVQILNPLYPLHQARNGFEAVKIIQQQSDIRLVLLDIRMPGQGGIETYEQIIALRPDISVVIVSGYIEDVPDSMMADNTVRGIIEKPVSEDMLLDAVAAAMGAAETI